MSDKKKLFERMNSIGQMPMNENMALIGGPSTADPMGMSKNFTNEEQGKGLISYLQDAYYQTGYFPVQNPDGSIRFIQNDDEFGAFLDKVQQSYNNIEIPF